MLKFCIGFFVLSVAFAYEQVVPHNPGNKSPDSYSELPCLLNGGICIPASHCPDGQLSKMSGLCPRQLRSGVECCHGISKYETRCYHRGGECMEKEVCPDKLTDKIAADCKTEESCCILVK
ncbi:U-scoloptoxin(19)-Sm1a-like [Epargyreus clarus]|uniref:U-scoloptoxin(19)-Sm1a-like n=1 Tax=Epargyreus clarus TaxID=520877 RepID=UPI003C2F92B7